MTNSNLQGRSSRKVKTVLKGSSVISALKFGLSLVVFTVFLVACPQPAPGPTPGPTPVATVDPPTFVPATGATPTRARDAELTINGPGGAMIRYNAGTGNVPDPTASGSGTDYNANEKPTFGELSPAGGMLTVKAIAIVSGTSSTVAEATYTVTVPPVIISATAITATEEGMAGEYTVRLRDRPAADTAVVISVTESSEAISLSPGSDDLADTTLLWFTSSANWDNGQTVRVTAAVDENFDDETATITHALNTVYDTITYDPAYYGADVSITTDDVTIPSVMVTTNDNDVPVVISATEITATEEGAAGTYTVSLTNQPAAGKVVVVRIGITGADSDAISVEPTTLWFGSTNSSTAQTVTVTADVDTNSDNETPTITHSLTPPTGGNPDPDYYSDNANFSIPDVEVTTQDNDIVAISATEITVDEGATTTYTVKLQRRPATGTAVIVRVAESSSAISLSSSGNVDQLDLWFVGAENWNDTLTVTVTAVDDDDNNINETPMITHSLVRDLRGAAVDPAYYNPGFSLPSVEVTVLDNNPGVRISESTLNIDESGTGSYTVGLNTSPTPGTRVILTPSYYVTGSAATTSSGIATVSPTVLYFDSANWNDSSARTVTVIPARDADSTDESINITYTISGTDTNYTGLSMGDIAVVAVNVNDDVVAGVTLGASTLTVNGPAGTTGMYSVVLNTQPTTDVRVTPTSGTPANATVPADFLTFTSTNWNTPQTVTVTSVANGESVITHAISGSATDYPSTLTVGEVTVTVSGISASR